MKEFAHPAAVSPTTKPYHTRSRFDLLLVVLTLIVAIGVFLTIIFMPSSVAHLQGSTAAGTDNQSLGNDYSSVSDQLGLNDQALNSADSNLNRFNLLTVAEEQLAIEDTLTNLASKFEARITDDATAGKNVASIQTTLALMKAEIRSTRLMSSSIETNLFVLQSLNHSSDHTVLMQYNNELKTAHGDCHIAHRYAIAIINDLKSLK